MKRFCRRVIAKNMGQPVFCGGNIVAQISEEKGKIHRSEVCETCGKPTSLSEDILSIPDNVTKKSLLKALS